MKHETHIYKIFFFFPELRTRCETPASHTAGCKLIGATSPKALNMLLSQEASNIFLHSLLPRYTAHFKMQWKVKSPFYLGSAVLSNRHVPKAHFNLLSSWFTLRDCLHLPPCHASLPLIISHEQCIICVSSKGRLLQQGNILFWFATRFTNTPPVPCPRVRK